MNPRSPAIFPIVLTCFFLSGLAGLIYQVAWARYLALILGHTSYAIVAVLVAFMAGLAIGSAFLGKMADRLERPLAAYAMVEFGIALYAFGFPALHRFTEGAYVATGGGLTAKFIFSALLILAPTILMGATLPMLTKFVTRSLGELRGRVASLYSINSLGAVAGCWVADFWWLPDYGLEVTVFGAGLLNLFAGLVAFALSRSTLEGAPTAASLQPPREENLESYTPAEIKLATIVIGASGFVAMLYEVAWTRLLALALGSSTHAFSIMLMTFIAGIATGSALLARRRLKMRSLDALGWIELSLGISIFVSMFLYEPLPYWFTRIGDLLARKETSYPLYEAAQALICFAVMFLPATLLGMTLPLASRIASSEIAATGRTVGMVFAVNTAGTVLGSAVTGFFLMPWFGLAGAFGAGVAINIAIGLAILFRERLPRLKGPEVAGVAAGCIGIAMVASFVFTGPWQRSFAQGVWRYRNATSLEDFRANGRSVQFRYHKDGPGATVAIATRTNQHMIAMALKVNGKTDASTGDFITQIMLAQVPALLHPTATNALIVGLGSGMTAGSLLRHTNIVQADCVEILPEILEAARHFRPFTDNALGNPRLKIIIDDAKSYLNTTEKKYDIIISEPSNPWMAGIATVFSQEHFAACRDRLHPGGVMAQWLHVYESDDRILRTVIKTFATAFPAVSIWTAESGDLVLIGSTEERATDIDAFLAKGREPRVSEELTLIGLNSPVTLLAREIVSQRNGAFLAGPEDAIHSDFYPTLDYMSQRAFFVGGSAKLHERLDETRAPRAETLLGQLLKKHRIDENDLRGLARLASENLFKDQRLVYSLLTRWIEENPATQAPYELLSRVTIERPVAVAEEARLVPRHAEIMQQAKVDPGFLNFYELTLIQAYRFKRSVLYTPAARELNEVLAILAERESPQRRLYYLHRAELAWDRGDDAACISLGLAALSPDSNLGPVDFSWDLQAPRIVLAAIVEAHLRAGNISAAYTTAQQATAGGYTRQDEHHYEPLALACRKAEALFQAAQNSRQQK